MASDRAREQLRQERETFEQARSHVARWFALRLCMGYIGIVLMALVAVVSTYVILHPACYGATVLGLAGTALLVDIVSLAVSIFRLVLQQGSITALEPVTRCPTRRRNDATDFQ